MTAAVGVCCFILLFDVVEAIRLMNELGNLIRDRRKAAGFLAEELAELIGVSGPTMSRIELGVGTQGISLLMAAKISLALGVSVNALAAAALTQIADAPPGPAPSTKGSAKG